MKCGECGASWDDTGFVWDEQCPNCGSVDVDPTANRLDHDSGSERDEASPNSEEPWVGTLGTTVKWQCPRCDDDYVEPCAVGMVRQRGDE